jgi:hypothetical protein
MAISSFIQYWRGRQHLPDCSSRHARGAYSGSIVMGESCYRQPARNGTRIQSPGSFDHACTSAEQSRTTGVQMALHPISSHWDLRWHRYSCRLCLVVYVLRTWSTDLLLPVGWYPFVHLRICV